MNLIKRFAARFRRKPLLVKPAVMQQRKLLLAFMRYLDKGKESQWFTHEMIVNEFLSKQ